MGTFEDIKYVFLILLFDSICLLLFVVVFNRIYSAKRMHECVRYFMTCYMQRMNLINGVKYNSIKGTFSNESLLKPRKPRGHSHPHAAGERNAASVFFKNCATKLGLDTYFYQLSTANQLSGERGGRVWYFGKDVRTRAQNNIVKNTDIICHVDDDYYPDMPQLLLDHSNPHLIYSLVPETVTGTSHETAFHFEGNTLISQVAGGAEYKHEIWNYSRDHLSVIGRESESWLFYLIVHVLAFSSWHCFFSFDLKLSFSFEFVLIVFQLLTWLRNATHVVYNVERRNVSKHRQYILLIPTFRVHGITSILSSMIFHNYNLERLEVNNGQYNVLRVHRGINGTTSRTVSIARDGTRTCVEMSHDVFDHCASLGLRRAEKSNKATPAEFKSYLGKTASLGDALIVCNYFNEFNERLFAKSAKVIYPVDLGVLRYQYNVYEYDPDAKPGLHSFMSCFFGPAPAPDICRNNDIRCIGSRVEKVRSEGIEIDEFMNRCAVDFIRELIPDDIAHTGHPVDLETVFLKQPKKSQQIILDSASQMGMSYSQMVKAFQKKEAYGKIGDPRNISTICGPDKLRYSAFMYAFSEEILKKQEWYSFGCKPRDIANRVAKICSEAKFVMLGDFSRMDGHVNRATRSVTEAIKRRYFDLQFHAELNELMESQYNRTAVTSFQVFYDTMMSRLSGSPETSGDNTLENIFLIYCAWRRTIKNKTHLGKPVYVGHKEAFDNLKKALVGGDDSLAADLPMEAYSKVCENWGHCATGEEIERGNRGVNFLARIYSPDVWNGDVNSMTSLKRTVYKFHTCSNLPDNSFEGRAGKLREKSLSALCNDANTPILGPFCKAAVKATENIKSGTGDASYWSFDQPEDCYPNEGEWMYAELEHELPLFDHLSFETHLSEIARPDVFCNVIGELLAFPLCAEAELAKAKEEDETVVVGEEAQGSAETPELEGHIEGRPVEKTVVLDVDSGKKNKTSKTTQTSSAGVGSSSNSGRGAGVKRSYGRGGSGTGRVSGGGSRNGPRNGGKVPRGPRR